MTVFTCTKKEIDSGQFPLEELKIFTVNTGAVVHVAKFAIIENGKVNYFQ